MDIEHFRSFLVLAKHQHFSNAAYEIHLSQSSLSKHIEKLEKAFSVKLFNRTTRTVLLTPAGKEFLIHARTIVAEFDLAQRNMLEYSGMERGRIILGAIPIISYLGLSALLTSFQQTYPGIELQIKEAESKTLLQWRHDLKIDIAFITQTDNTSLNRTFDIYPLIPDELVLVTKKFHPLAERKIMNLSEAANEKYIFMTPSSTAYNICIDTCRHAGFEPTVVHESSYLDTIISLVSAGLGVSLVSFHVANSFTTRFPIELIHLEQPSKITVALAIPPNLDSVRCIRAFKKFTLEWFKLNLP